MAAEGIRSEARCHADGTGYVGAKGEDNIENAAAEEALRGVRGAARLLPGGREQVMYPKRSLASETDREEHGPYGVVGQRVVAMSPIGPEVCMLAARALRTA